MAGPEPTWFWETDDLGEAAYVLAKGLELDRVHRSPENREFGFRFRDPELRGGTLRIAFVNSPEKKFDEAVRTLKKLSFGSRR